jgi:hypothetical protein
MKSQLLRLIALFLLVCALFAGIGVAYQSTHAAACTVWYHCPVTQRYGVNQEHGVDLATHGLPITAWRSGYITFIGRECWEWPCIWDITWKLDYPSHAGGSRYMYVQIASVARGLHVGSHVVDWQYLGGSSSFIEFGLTPDWAYGVSNWRWGIDPLRLWPYL